MKVEIRNIKVSLSFSKETYCSTADIYVDGKKVGYAENNGCGGSTKYNRYPEFSYDVIREVENYFASMPDKEYSLPNGETIKLKSSLELFIDDAIDDKFSKMETARINKKMQKDFQKYICYKVDGGYASFGWKNYRIDQMLGTPVGDVLIQKKVDELKAKGFFILNTNLVGINL